MLIGCILPRMTTTTRTRLTGPMSRRLRAIREEAGISQAALAEAIGCSLKNISNYESPKYGGARKRPFVKAWCDACSGDFEEVWGAADDQPSLRSGWLSGTAA